MRKRCCLTLWCLRLPCKFRREHQGGGFHCLTRKMRRPHAAHLLGRIRLRQACWQPGVTTSSLLLSPSRQLSFVFNLPPLNKAMQNPLIAFNHFPINSPASRALFKAYRIKSISTKTLFWSGRWKSGGSSEKKRSLESVLPTLGALRSGVGTSPPMSVELCLFGARSYNLLSVQL